MCDCHQILVRSLSVCAEWHDLCVCCVISGQHRLMPVLVHQLVCASTGVAPVIMSCPVCDLRSVSADACAGEAPVQDPAGGGAQVGAEGPRKRSSEGRGRGALREGAYYSDSAGTRWTLLWDPFDLAHLTGI